MFNIGDIVIYKDNIYIFYCYDDSKLYANIYRFDSIIYDCIVVGSTDIVKYSIIERDDKFTKLFDDNRDKQ